MTPSLTILVSEMETLIADLRAKRNVTNDIKERDLINTAIESLIELINLYKNQKS